MQIKEFSPGDKVEIKTRERIWTGHILESYDSEIILLKISSGYNIGIRENKILNAKLLEKADKIKKSKEKISLNKNLPNIAVVITGGTISSRLDSKTGAVIPTDEKAIFSIAPEIKEFCNIIKIKTPFMKLSEDMGSSDWKILAKIVYELLNDKEVEGIVVTHGTDTLHYTSAALSFYLKNINKPIAITYSQRSIDRGSTDASLNLICAAKYAISDIAEIALIGHKDLNDKVCLAMQGTKVRKMHTSRRDAFRVINDIPIAEITKEHIEILKPFNIKDKNKKPILDAKCLDKVALIKITPGQNPDILDYYEKKKYKGIILELTGLGQAPSTKSKYNWLPKIKKLVEKGIIVCGVAQTLYGQLNPNVYSTGRDLQKTGILFLKDMLPETAFVKLSWILGHKSLLYNKEKAKEKMLENVAGEFNESLRV